MEKTKTRFANYGSYGLLCGADGLPHLIVDGDLNHAGEFLVRLFRLRNDYILLECSPSVE
jgi:hypothetical protein